MKLIFCSLYLFFFLLLLFTACQKTNDIKVPAINAATTSNTIVFDNTLDTIDLSSLVPSALWWNDEDGSVTNTTVGTIDKKQYIQFHFIKAALAHTGLNKMLSDSSHNYTLFAPSDAAFMKAGFATIDDLLAIGKEALTQLLLYHIVSGKIFTAYVPIVANTPFVSLHSDTLFVTQKINAASQYKVSVDGAGVYIPDVTIGNNDVVQVINKVLMYPTGNLLETMAANANLSYCVAAINRTGAGSNNIAALLSNPGSFTVFAPSNEAFINAGFATIDAIKKADPNALAAMLTYQIAAVRMFASDVKSGDKPTMLNGETAKFVRTGEIPDKQLGIKGESNTLVSQITSENILATNGVIYVSNQVLLP